MSVEVEKRTCAVIEYCDRATPDYPDDVGDELFRLCRVEGEEYADGEVLALEWNATDPTVTAATWNRDELVNLEDTLEAMLEFVREVKAELEQ